MTDELPEEIQDQIKAKIPLGRVADRGRDRGRRRVPRDAGQLHPRHRSPRERRDVRGLIADAKGDVLTNGGSAREGAPAGALPVHRRDRRAGRRSTSSRGTPIRPKTPTSTGAISPAIPSRPGVILIETAAQAAVVAFGIALYAREAGSRRRGRQAAHDLHRLRRSTSPGTVRPGDRVTTTGQIKFWRRKKLRASFEMKLDDGTRRLFRRAVGHGSTAMSTGSEKSDESSSPAWA